MSSDAVLRFENCVIPHANHDQACRAIQRLHARYRPPASGRHFTARAMLLVGGSGSGKTTALEAYQSQFPDLTLEAAESGEIEGLSDDLYDRLRDGDLRRVVTVEVPQSATRRSVVAAILTRFGYRPRNDWNTSEVIERIAFYAEELGTELILLDEAHHIINERNPEATIEITEFLKSLLNRVKVQLVIAGLPRLLAVISDDARATQFRRRLEPTLTLVPYDWGTREGRIQFMAILHAMEQAMDLPQSSGLSLHEVAKRVYAASGGEIGLASKYLSEALRVVESEALPSISLDVLARAYEAFHSERNVASKLQDLDAPPTDRTKAGSLVTSSPNPFTCDSTGLLTVLRSHEQFTGPRSLVGDTGRATRIRASGPPSFTAFGRIA